MKAFVAAGLFALALTSTATAQPLWPEEECPYPVEAAVPLGKPLPSDFVMASMMLHTPVGVEEPIHMFTPEVRAAIREICVREQWMSPNEQWLTGGPTGYQQDMDYLRQRVIEVKDCPKIEDGFRFMPQKDIYPLKAFNRAYRKHLEVRLAWEADRADVIGAAIEETDHLYKIWDTLCDAQGEYGYVSYRRIKLNELKGLIGEEAYMSGTMPDYVPIWRFNTR